MGSLGAQLLHLAGMAAAELRLRGIGTVEEANRFLREQYIAALQRSVAKTAGD